MSDDGSLTANDKFLLIMTGIGSPGICAGVMLQFILKSRCTKLSFCCKACECDRDVLPAGQVVLDTSALSSIGGMTASTH